ncbi:MAG: tRNA (adenosine(37)-N6)-threonylcarbamoyltransferase complex transferase subunit TsaD [Desulfobacterales bacterium]|nr:tRNA (adenosine(37)-N6)-threonylcarbamoyltransferase complex transferase subunit TsaD [Desulfobacterales bacterium]
MIVLGIESSCDETAAAVVVDGKTVLSSEVATQIEIHRPYGGVVPELASRQHIESVAPVVRSALDRAGLSADGVDAVAVTQGPGLVGALLVGFCFAKAWAFARGVPWVGVNHLEGHVNSLFLTENPPSFPFVALLVSGGHTSLYQVTGPVAMTLIGQTRDDAAGEAFDKVAKMLGLGYPGGVVIDRLGQGGNPDAIAFPRSYLDKERFDFSFSGLKTAVSRYLQTHPEPDAAHVSDIVAGFQEAVVDVLSHKLIHAARTCRCDQVAVVGGVAANSRLRERVTAAAAGQGLSVHIPPISLCGDNAAMIAAAGYHHLSAGRCADLGADVFSRDRTGVAGVGFT